MMKISYNIFLSSTVILLISVIVVALLVTILFLYSAYENKKMQRMNQELVKKNDRINTILYATKSSLWGWHYGSDRLIVDELFKDIIHHDQLDYKNITFGQWKELTLSQDQELFDMEFEKLRSGEKDFIDFEYRLVDSNGNKQWIHCYAKVLFINPDGSPKAISGIINNITMEKEATREKEHVNYLLEHVIENNNGGVAIYDKNMNYIYVSNKFKNQFSLTDDIIGKNHYELFPDLPEKFKEAHRRSLQGEILGENKDTFIRSTGEKMYTIWSTRPWYDKDGNIGGIISYVEIITEQVKKELNLEYAIKHDKLTGLLNRSFFTEEFIRLDQEEKYPIGVMMMDLNGLKIINDAYGFKSGDEVLKMISKSLEKISKDCGSVFRLGGDEFAFLAEYMDEETLKSCIREIHQSIEKLEFNNIKLSVSIGYAVKNNPDVKIEDILREAETNMYSRKVLDGTSIRNNAIRGILQTLNNKYEIEKTHSDRVQKLCIAMGEALGLEKDDLNELSYAAILHDIGKIAIPDAILMKPAKLTFEEFEMMKTHTEKGYHILRAADEYSDIAKYALTHHEKYDGSGYPNGIVGEDIPYFSRIISICDAFEAMTADRPYRRAQSVEFAINELNKYANTQFDPKLVKVFIEEIIPKNI
ncbi:MAG: hypothetical protein CVV57_09550 [Tenericutes bacterium HGW-Tenericutes-2]|nr:MAG: hypothetical protein CVV57_09550 [Tenericutes bacterium HGW-Tenericutes-2]